MTKGKKETEKSILLKNNGTVFDRKIDSSTYNEIMNILNSDLFESRWFSTNVVYTDNDVTIEMGSLDISDLGLAAKQIDMLALIGCDNKGVLIMLPDFHCLFFNQTKEEKITLLSDDSGNWNVKVQQLKEFFS